MASATGAHVAGTGTLVLPPQHASSGAPAVSITGGHDCVQRQLEQLPQRCMQCQTHSRFSRITDSVVLRLVPRRKKKVCAACNPNRVVGCNQGAVRTYSGSAQPVHGSMLKPCVCRLLSYLSCCAYSAAMFSVLQSVKWAEDVADIDEHAGKKKSKSGCTLFTRWGFDAVGGSAIAYSSEADVHTVAGGLLGHCCK